MEVVDEEGGAEERPPPSVAAMSSAACSSGEGVGDGVGESEAVDDAKALLLIFGPSIRTKSHTRSPRSTRAPSHRNRTIVGSASRTAESIGGRVTRLGRPSERNKSEWLSSAAEHQKSPNSTCCPR